MSLYTCLMALAVFALFALTSVIAYALLLSSIDSLVKTLRKF